MADFGKTTYTVRGLVRQQKFHLKLNSFGGGKAKPA